MAPRTFSPDRLGAYADQHARPALRDLIIRTTPSAASRRWPGVVRLFPACPSGLHVEHALGQQPLELRGQLIGPMAFLLLLIPIALVLSGVHGSAGLAFVALLVGFSFGSEMDVAIYLSTRYFDSRIFITILGAIMGLLMLGNGIGAAIPGRIFDATGNYRLFLAAVIPLVLISSLLTRTLGPYARASAL